MFSEHIITVNISVADVIVLKYFKLLNEIHLFKSRRKCFVNF